MALSEKTLSALEKLFTGNGALPPNGERIAPYRTGPELVQFFNRFGFADEYAQGFPARWAYAKERILALDATPKLAKAVEAALHPREYLDTPYDAAVAAEYLNRYLKFDGLELVLVSGLYRLRTVQEPGPAIDAALLASDDPLTEHFVREQVEKCSRKLSEGDYDGAITNARTLVEAVLREVERRLDAKAPAYDGDLLKLFKRGQRLMNLVPEREDVSEALRQVLRGLASVVAGLAPLRNKMGDAHPSVHRPHRHHALLAVNAAMTLAGFILESFQYQVATGTLPNARVPFARRDGG